MKKNLRIIYFLMVLFFTNVLSYAVSEWYDPDYDYWADMTYNYTIEIIEDANATAFYKGTKTQVKLTYQELQDGGVLDNEIIKEINNPVIKIKPGASVKITLEGENFKAEGLEYSIVKTPTEIYVEGQNVEKWAPVGTIGQQGSVYSKIEGEFLFPETPGYYYVLLDLGGRYCTYCGDPYCLAGPVETEGGVVYGPFLMAPYGLPEFEIETDKDNNGSVDVTFADKNPDGEEYLEDNLSPAVEITKGANFTISVKGQSLDTGVIYPDPGQYFQLIHTGTDPSKPEYPVYNNSWKLIGIPEVTVEGGTKDEIILKDIGKLKVDNYDVSHLQVLGDEEKWKNLDEVYGNGILTSSLKEAMVLEGQGYDWDSDRYDIEETGQSADVIEVFDAINGPTNAFFNLLHNKKASEDDKYAMKMHGYFIPKEDGDYKFGAYMDDGVNIYLENNNQRNLMLSDFNTGPSHYKYGDAVTNLKAGEAYSIVIEWFSWGTAHALRLYYSVNDSNFELIPSTLFCADLEKIDGTPSKITSGSVSKNFPFSEDYGYYYIALNISNGKNERRVMQGPFFVAPEASYPVYTIEPYTDEKDKVYPYIKTDKKGEADGFELNKKSPLSSNEEIPDKNGARIGEASTVDISVEGDSLKIDGQWYSFKYIENDFDKADGNNGWHTGDIPKEGTLPARDPREIATNLGELDKWYPLGEVKGGVDESDVDRSKMGYLYSRKFNVEDLDAMNDSQWVNRELVFAKPEANATYMSAGEEKAYNNVKQDVFSERVDTNQDTAAYKFWGYLIPPDAGKYRFRFISDDGIKAYFGYNGLTTIANSFVPQSSTTVGGNEEFALLADTPYSLQIEWFNYGGSQELRMEYQKDGGSWDSVPAIWFCPSVDIEAGNGDNILTPKVQSSFEFPNKFGHYYVLLDVANDFGFGADYEFTRQVVYGPFTLPEPMEINLDSPSLTEETRTGEPEFNRSEDGKEVLVTGIVTDKYYKMDYVEVYIYPNNSGLTSVDQVLKGKAVDSKYDNTMGSSIGRNDFNVRFEYDKLIEESKKLGTNKFDVYVIGYNKEGDVVIDFNNGVIKNVLLDVYPAIIKKITVVNKTTRDLWKSLKNDGNKLFEGNDSRINEYSEMYYTEGSLDLNKIKERIINRLYPYEEEELTYLEKDSPEYCYFKPGDKISLQINYIEDNFNEKLINFSSTYLKNDPNEKLVFNINEDEVTLEIPLIVSYNASSDEVAKSNIGLIDNYGNDISEILTNTDLGIYDNINPDRVYFLGNQDETIKVYPNSLDSNIKNSYYTNGVFGDFTGETYLNDGSYNLKMEAKENGNIEAYNLGIRAFVVVYDYKLEGDVKRKGIQETGYHDGDKGLASTINIEDKWIGTLNKKVNSNHGDDGKYIIHNILAIDKAGNINISQGETSVYSNFLNVAYQKEKNLFVDTISPEIQDGSEFVKLSGSFGNQYEPIIIDDKAVKYGDTFSVLINAVDSNISNEKECYPESYSVLVDKGDTSSMVVTTLSSGEDSISIQIGDSKHNGKLYDGIEKFIDGSEDNKTIGVTQAPDVGEEKDKAINPTIKVRDLAGNVSKKVSEFELDGLAPKKLELRAFAREAIEKDNYNREVKKSNNSNFKTLYQILEEEGVSSTLLNPGETEYHFTKADEDIIYLGVGENEAGYNDENGFAENSVDIKLFKTLIEKRFYEGTAQETFAEFSEATFSRVYPNGSISNSDIEKTEYDSIIAYNAKELMNSSIGNSSGALIEKDIFLPGTNALYNYKVEAIDNAGWPAGKFDVNLKTFALSEPAEAKIVVDTVAGEPINYKTKILNGVSATAKYDSGNGENLTFNISIDFQGIEEYAGLWKYIPIEVIYYENADISQDPVDREDVRGRDLDVILNTPYNYPTTIGLGYRSYPTGKQQTPSVEEFTISSNSIMNGSKCYLKIKLFDNLNNMDEYYIPILVPKSSLKLRSGYNDKDIVREKTSDLKVVGQEEFEIQSAREGGRESEN